MYTITELLPRRLEIHFQIQRFLHYVARSVGHEWIEFDGYVLVPDCVSVEHVQITAMRIPRQGYEELAQFVLQPDLPDSVRSILLVDTTASGFANHDGEKLPWARNGRAFATMWGPPGAGKTSSMFRRLAAKCGSDGSHFAVMTAPTIEAVNNIVNDCFVPPWQKLGDSTSKLLLEVFGPSKLITTGKANTVDARVVQDCERSRMPHEKAASVLAGLLQELRGVDPCVRGMSELEAVRRLLWAVVREREELDRTVCIETNNMRKRSNLLIGTLPALVQAEMLQRLQDKCQELGRKMAVLIVDEAHYTTKIDLDYHLMKLVGANIIDNGTVIILAGSPTQLAQSGSLKVLGKRLSYDLVAKTSGYGMNIFQWMLHRWHVLSQRGQVDAHKANQAIRGHVAIERGNGFRLRELHSNRVNKLETMLLSDVCCKGLAEQWGSIPAWDVFDREKIHPYPKLLPEFVLVERGTGPNVDIAMVQISMSSDGRTEQATLIQAPRIAASDADAFGMLTAFAAQYNMKQHLKVWNVPNPKVAIVVYYGVSRIVGEVLYHLARKHQYPVPDAILTVPMATGLTFDGVVLLLPRNGQYYNRHVMSAQRLVTSISRARYQTILVEPERSGWKYIEQPNVHLKETALSRRVRHEMFKILSLAGEVRLNLSHLVEKLLTAVNKNGEFEQRLANILTPNLQRARMCHEPYDAQQAPLIREIREMQPCRGVPSIFPSNTYRKGWEICSKKYDLTWMPKEAHPQWNPSTTAANAWSLPWASVVSCGQEATDDAFPQAYVYLAVEQQPKEKEAQTQLLAERAAIQLVGLVGTHLGLRRKITKAGKWTNCTDHRQDRNAPFRIYFAPHIGKSTEYGSEPRDSPVSNRMDIMLPFLHDKEPSRDPRVKLHPDAFALWVNLTRNDVVGTSDPNRPWHTVGNPYVRLRMVLIPKSSNMDETRQMEIWSRVVHAANLLDTTYTIAGKHTV